MNNLPPLDKDLLEKIGVPIGKVKPVAPIVDFGISFGSATKAAPSSLSPDEATELFGQSFAVKMNFIPQMIIAVAMDESLKFIDYCAEKRIAGLKKHNRLIRQCVQEYADHLKESYGTAFKAYGYYVERYLELILPDRFRMRCSISNVVNLQRPGELFVDGMVHVAIIRNLIDYAENYDRRMDHAISEKFHKPVFRRQDARLKLIIAMCIEFEETWGFKVDPDPTIEANIRVLSNRASSLADEIILEETNVSKS